MPKTNKNLQNAKKAKNDEFWTRIEDIEKEIPHYDLSGKWVYSPCDDFRWSAFKKYFTTNFDELGLSHYTCTCYDIGEGAWRYDYDGTKETAVRLEGDGDFMGWETKDITIDCDAIITNPPFSKWGEYFKYLTDYGKDFLLVGNKNAMLWKSIFPRYFNKELYFGYNYISKFKLPDGSYNWFEGTGRWFTTFPTEKNNPPIQLVEYNPEIHKTYDTYPAVNTNSIRSIPDIDGEIGVPIGIIDYLCKEQFEITGMLCRGSGGCDKAKPIIEGNHLYSRVLIKKK